MKTKLGEIKITLTNWRLAFTLALVFHRGPEDKWQHGGNTVGNMMGKCGNGYTQIYLLFLSFLGGREGGIYNNSSHR